MKLSPIGEKLLQEKNPEVIKMILGGKFPLPPKELIYLITNYGIENRCGLKDSCIKALKSFPINFYDAFFKEQHISEDSVFFLSYVFQHDTDVLDKIFKHPSTPQKVFELFSKHSDPLVLRRLIEVESRWVNNQKVIDNLIQNSNLPLEFAEKIKFYKKEEEHEKIVHIENIIPTEQDKEKFAEFIKETEEPIDDVESKRSLSGKITKMSVAEKIKLALMGNKEVRGILIKDSNKLVSTAVLKNPRITDGEIIKITQDKNANEEIIRLICHNNNWTQNYAIKFNLVMHPKTPLQLSLKFLSSLSVKDLSTVAKSKNIPSALAVNARKILVSRSK